jgi:hypothetical protein
VIGNLEAVMSHYAADQLMRSDYVQDGNKDAASLQRDGNEGGDGNEGAASLQG